MFGNSESKKKYADIINAPHHKSSKRPHMPVKDRAAQFAPFAALTGHNEAMKMTEKYVEEEYNKRR